MLSNDKELLDQANIARRVAFTLAESIYKYAGNEINKEDLINAVNLLLRKDLVKLLEHKYILKDITACYLTEIPSDAFGEDFNEDDTDTLTIIERSN